MKRTIVALLGLLLWSGVFAQGIHFEKTTLAKALEKAKQENKLVFVDAFAIWCGPCKMMEQTVFKDKGVGEYFDRHIVALKIDVERGEGPKVKQEYAVEGLPGYLFLDPAGRVVYREKGRKSVEKFMEMVHLAEKYAKDPNSVGRLAARYLSEKNDEKFVAFYLDKLKETNSKGYFEPLNHYLRIQTTMKPESSEMAKFLHEHWSALYFGGLGDSIIKANFYTDGWKAVVRKDIRQDYQYLPKRMAEQTTEYAIESNNIALLDVAMQRAAEEGVALPEDQKERVLMYYYLRTENGEAYKKLARPRIEAFYNSLNVTELQEKHLSSIEYFKNETRRWRSFAMRDSEQLRYMVSDYAKFVVTDADKADVLRWSKRCYDLVSDKYGMENINNYANMLYRFGDRKLALELKRKALEFAKGSKLEDGVRMEYETMNAGKPLDVNTL